MAEFNTKKQQLTYHKGITNSPSDYVCSDNELANEVGMIFNGSEHQPIQNPVEITTNWLGRKLLMVHTLKGGGENFILIDSSNNLSFSPDYTTEPTFIVNKKVNNISAIGNTLIINSEGTLHYFLWKGKGINYANLGNKIPEPKMLFNLATPWDSSVDSYAQMISSVNIAGMLDKNPLDEVTIVVKDDKVNEYNDAIIGGYSENKKDAEKHNWFVNPFAVRYALELYDGSYVLHSEPIMLFPTFSENTFARIYKIDDNGEMLGLYLHTSVRELIFRVVSADYTNWTDIVKNITVFVSPQVDVYNTIEDQKLRFDGRTVVLGTSVTMKRDAICTSTKSTDGVLSEVDTPSNIRYYSTTYTDRLNDAFYTLNKRAAANIADELGKNGTFFKIFEFPVTKNIYNWNSSVNYMSEGVLSILESQSRLPNDYYTHTQLKSPSSLLTYNNRLHLVAPYRSFYVGGETLIRHDFTGYISAPYDIYVHIQTDSGERIINHYYYTYERLDRYFYYPDPRAYKVEIFINSALVVNETLTPHPSLNGAYFFKYPTSEDMPSATGDAPTENMKDEYLLNQIFTSEVNNPFVFKAEGNNSLDVQNIIGMATMTTALSQGQFGQYPMIVFTNDGIWAMQTNAEGVYTSIVPLSREVCNNPKSITQTDGAVFFSSEKGLMVIVGSEVKCVSEQLNGKYTEEITPLQNILKDSGLIAYDYRDSLLWILDDATGTIYIYNIKAGAFAQFKWQGELLFNVVNHYPDTLLQDEVGNVYSLLSKPNINSDEFDTYEASIETRPMKLEDAFAFKSLRQLKNVFDSESGTCTLKIEASNDMKTWTEITSLKGKGWKYFKFKYTFANMKATDRFAGTIIVTQQRFDNKLR